MLFKYKGVDEEGVNKEGDIDAPNRDMAISSLQRRGLVVVSIKAEGEKKSVFEFTFLGTNQVVLMSNLIASLIFFITGVLIIYLKSIGRLGMEDTEGFTKLITNTSTYVNQFVGDNIFLNIAFVALVGLGIYRILKKL